MGQAHRAVALQHRDAAAALGLRHAHGVPHRAPLVGEIRDRDAARTALVDAPDSVLAQRNREQRGDGTSHQPPRTWISFLTVATPSTFLATSSARRLSSGLST